jgi:hypothetical protein
VNTSVIWIAPSPTARVDAAFGKLRAAGLLPVRADSTGAALRVLTQFRAGVVVYQAGVENGAGDCERLVDAGAAVVTLITDVRYAQIYLSVGCAAAVADTCPIATLIPILRDAAAGKRNIVWPLSGSGALPASAAG